MDASPRGGEADLESFFRPGLSGPLCDSRDIAMSPLVLSDSSNCGETPPGYTFKPPVRSRIPPPAILPSSLLALPSFFRSCRCFHLTCFYNFQVKSHPVRDIVPIHWFDYTHVSEHGFAEGVPKAFNPATRSLEELGLDIHIDFCHCITFRNDCWPEKKLVYLTLIFCDNMRQ